MDILNPSFLEGQLQILCNSLSPEDGASAVNTLLKIIQNAIDNPGIEQYRRLRTENKTFYQRVWRHLPAQDFLAAMGWTLVDNTIVLPSDADHLLQDALIELIKAKSVLDERAPEPSSGPQMVTQKTELSSKTNSEYQERMKELREMQKKANAEKKRIADQMKSDRRETDQKEAKASHGRQLEFGANLSRFKDIGVDLNAGGG